MTLKQVYGMFMDSCEYGHTRIEAYKMTLDFYEACLNTDLKKSIYKGGLRMTLHLANPCLVMIHGYPILITKEFNEKYAFEAIKFISLEEEYRDSINKA